MAFVEDFDRAAARLFALISTSCDRRANFAGQLETALRTALDAFAADPELSRLLTLSHHGQDLIALRRVSWSKTYAELLRGAADRAPEASAAPAIRERFLIGAIIRLIARHGSADPQQERQ